MFKQWALFDILGQIVSAAALTLTMYLTKNIILLIGAYFIPYILMRGLSTYYVMKYYVAPIAPHDPEARAYGNAMTIFQVMSRGIASIDQLVLYHLLGPAQVAIFALATALPNRMQSVYRITGSLALPKFAERTAQEVAQGLPRKMFFFTLFVLTGAGAYAIVAPYLFTYIFPQYIPSIQYSQVVVLYTLSAITYPFGALLIAHKRIKDNYTLAIIGFCTKVVVLGICVPLYGIWGAVFAMLANSLVTIMLSLWLLFKDAHTTHHS